MRTLRAAGNHYFLTLARLLEIGDRRTAPVALVKLALVAESDGEPALAARCLGASRQLLDGRGVDFRTMPEHDVEAIVYRLRDAMGTDAFEREWASGFAADPASLIGTRS